MSSELTHKIKDYIELELKYSQELQQMAAKLKHPVLRTIFESISKDSEKHSLMYQSMLKLLTEIQPLISEEEYLELSKAVDKHIEVEVMMLKEVEALLSRVEDPRIKLIAAAIKEDEERHHKLLVSIRKNMAMKETLSELDFWNSVWKDSPYHGTPAGD